MAELIDEINEIIGEDVEQMVIGGEAVPQRNEYPQRGGQNIQDPVEEILNPPRAPSPAQEFIIHVNPVPAAPAGSARRQPQHGRRGGGGNRGRGARGRHGYRLYRGTTAGRQVQRRREATQFVEWLGLLQRQACNNRHR